MRLLRSIDRTLSALWPTLEDRLPYWARRDQEVPAPVFAPDGAVLVISHDVHLAGAQQVLLSVLRAWQQPAPFPVRVVSVGPGVLRPEFERLFPTLFLSDYYTRRSRAAALAAFAGVPTRAIYANTVVNGPLLTELRRLGAPVLTHCHELQTSIERWAPREIMAQTLTHSDAFVCASRAIADNLVRRHMVPRDRVRVVYASIDLWDDERAPPPSEREALRDELHVDAHDLVVFGCGTTDARKGADIFLDVALDACRRMPALRFVWIGGEAKPPAFQRAIDAAGLGDRVHFIGQRANARRYFYVGDLFALTSREDPCALVALEAANARLPVVCFDGAGDIPLVLGPDAGAVVPMADRAAFVGALLRLADDAALRRQLGATGDARVRARHESGVAAAAIADIVEETARGPRVPLGYVRDTPLVTVIIPSYNHARFLGPRLESVLRQTVDELEILVLDDASTDDSQGLLERFVQHDRRAQLFLNQVNSGSAFSQWRKGLARARGRYVWIAESDDAARRNFLEVALASLERDRGVALAHVQSLMIDARGKRLGLPVAWLDELAKGRWSKSFTSDGMAEIRDYLAYKNTVPNASGVVFRNFPGIEQLVDDSMRLCADWLFWVRLLARGDYAFVSRPLNLWRQRSSNARTGRPGELEWEEGQRVIGQIGDLLGLRETERTRLLTQFRGRCMAWGGPATVSFAASLRARLRGRKAG